MFAHDIQKCQTKMRTFDWGVFGPGVISFLQGKYQSSWDIFICISLCICGLEKKPSVAEWMGTRGQDSCLLFLSETDSLPNPEKIA